MAKLLTAGAWRADGQKADSAIVKQFTSEAVVDDLARTARFTITTGAVDRENDVIVPDGWHLENYLKNPVVLFGHNYRALPVGKATEVVRTGNGLMSTVQFPEEGTYDFADTVFRLVKGGFLKATSVGFRPMKWARNEERQGYDFMEAELLEWSIVPVPANPEALIAASAQGVDLEPLRKWLADAIDAWPGELKLPGRTWKKLLDASDDPALARQPSDIVSAMAHMEQAMTMCDDLMQQADKAVSGDDMRPMRDHMRQAMHALDSEHPMGKAAADAPADPAETPVPEEPKPDATPADAIAAAVAAALAPMGRVLERLEERLAERPAPAAPEAVVELAAEPADGEFVLELSDEETFDVDMRELAEAVRSGCRDLLAEAVSRETQGVVNKLLGRVD